MNLARLKAWMGQRFVPLLPAAFREGKMPSLLLFEVLLIVALLVFPFFNPYDQPRAVSFAFSLALMVQLVLISRGMSLSAAIHLTCLIGAVYLFNAVWVSGGVLSPRLAWLLVIPVIPFYIIGPAAGSAWLGVVFALQALLAVLTAQGWVAQPLPPGDGQSVYAFATFSMVTVMLVIIPTIYDRLHRAALQESKNRQQELERKQRELEQTLQMRENFIASVSHELRTPMNAILGFNSLLMERIQHKPRARQILDHTRQSADHLMTVINDVLDYSQFMSGRLTAQAETFALRTTIDNAFDLFAPKVKSMHLDYRCEIEPTVPEWVITDRHRLMQILVNLLGNALKFTHQGRVCLRVQSHPKGVLFSVEDTGIGIPVSDQAHIFTRFVQAQGEIQKRYGGNGLGLAITQGLVDLLHGEIGFESEQGRGSRFWFLLPLTAAPAPVKKADTKPVVQTTQTLWRFLVVDDHPVNRLLVKQVLKNAWPGCEVGEASNGLEAIKAMTDAGYDLVLMDMVMPVMDGSVATQKLRHECPEPICSVPILGLTANVNPVDLDTFKTAGLSDVMLKPFEPAQLCAKVEQLLLQRQA